MRKCLLEVEGKHNHLRVGLINSHGVRQNGFVFEMGRMVAVEAVGQPIHEFQFGAELEKRQVKVATDAGF